MGRPQGAKDKQPRKGNKNWEKSINPELPEGYNTNLVAFLREVEAEGPLEDKHDVAEMERRFRRYLMLCEEYDQKIGNMAAYMAIGVNKDEINDWVFQKGVNPARTLFAKRVKQFCASYRESLMNDGKVKEAVGIFWQKNYDGLRDVQERVNVNVDPLGDSATLDALRDRYVGAVEAPAIVDAQAEDAGEP